MKKALLLLFLFITSHVEVFPQSDSISDYVTAALDIMQERSVNKNKVDWESLRSLTLKRADTVSSVRNTYPVILDALKELKDSHSNFYPPEQIAAYKMGYRAMGMQFPTPQSRMLEGKYAYIMIPSFAAINLEEQREFSASIQAAIEELDKQDPKGWIIDLRKNDGGMSSPMLAGVGPFIEKDKAVGWKNSDGVNTYWIYKNGKIHENDHLIYEMKSKPYRIKNKKRPVAVLIGKNTASAGEILAAAFVGRSRTKLIGANTQGLTSSNNEHELLDGAYLVLTEGNYIDRNNKEYDTIGQGISPDIRLESATQDESKMDSLYLDKSIEFFGQRGIK